MGSIVGFSWALFAATYPELAPVGQTLATEYFTVATMIHRNDGGGPISNPAMQLTLLNMLTAHVAWLYAPRDSAGNPAATGVPAPNVTGQITSASEGSVSVSTQAMTAFNTAQAQWLAQSRYGQLYWVSTASFRTMRYRPFCDPRRLVR